VEEALVVAAQQLHAHRYALLPLPGQQADVAGGKRRLEEILLVGGVIHVALKQLQRKVRPR